MKRSCVTLIMIVLTLTSLLASNMLEARPPEKAPTVYINIYRIMRVDPIETPEEDGADWYWRIRVWDGEGWLEEISPAINDTDSPIPDVTYAFQIRELTTRILIYLLESDPPTHEEADISGNPERTHAAFNYDLRTDELTGETIAPEAYGRFITSGVFDGSAATDENDAHLWFKIWDNYDLPTAEAGPSQTISYGERAYFDGKESQVSNISTIIKYEWDFDGDGTYDAEGKTVSHTYTARGTFTVKLRVTDDLGGTDTDTTEITVLNLPPKASFTFEPEEPRVGQEVQFSDQSSDPEGFLKSWLWSFGDGESSTERNPKHTYEKSGTYEVTLTITDDMEVTDSHVTEITVLNLPPKASFTFEPEEPRVGQEVQFSDQSSDPEGFLKSWLWSFGDGESSTERNPKHTYRKGGTYQVTLTVKDNEGVTDSHVTEITVLNLPPKASFTFEPEEPRVGQEVQFSDQSSDPEGFLKSWLWSFGDGESSTERNPKHTYKLAGTYTVTLTIEDNEGSVSTEAATINVSEIPILEQRWFYILIAIIAGLVVAVILLTQTLKFPRPEQVTPLQPK